jgi:hypothetical protein
MQRQTLAVIGTIIGVALFGQTASAHGVHETCEYGSSRLGMGYHYHPGGYGNAEPCTPQRRGSRRDDDDDAAPPPPPQRRSGRGTYDADGGYTVRWATGSRTISPDGTVTHRQIFYSPRGEKLMRTITEGPYGRSVQVVPVYD